MPQQNRISLKSYFLTGSKPTQLQFADFVDSVTNIKEDGVTSDGAGNTIFNQGITIKNSSIDTVGSIRWNGTNFQFRDNTGWQNLNLSGGGGSQWTTIGANINYAAGNVGIGVPAGATYKLEVNLNNSAGTVNQADTVRLGSMAIFNDAFNTYISHRNMAALTTYALAQDGSGNVIVNSATGRTISFFEGGAMRANIQTGVLTIGNTPGGTTNLLTVNGNASKTGGGTWNATSDRRVKTDIAPFHDGLDLLKKLKPVNYKYNGKAGIVSDANFIGLVAQDVQEIFPYMVGSYKGRLESSDAQETDILTVDASALTYVMVNSLKELDARLARLETLQHATMEA